jgi:acyl carrier protein
MTNTDTALRAEVRSRIEAFVRQVCGFRGDITDDVSFTEIDIDSLELVALTQELQREYGVALNDERLLGLDRVGQAVDLVTQRITASRAVPSDAQGHGDK